MAIQRGYAASILGCMLPIDQLVYYNVYVLLCINICEKKKNKQTLCYH